MAQLPSYILNQIPAHLSVHYWTRRAFYETIEELSDALWWGVLIETTVYGLYQLTGDPNMQYGMLALLYPLMHYVIELLRWQHEIYIVCSNEQSGGGHIFKFWGIFSYRHIEDAIDARQPAVTDDEPWNYRIWGWLTGEHMKRVHISSQNNAYIDGKRLPPGLVRAIGDVRGKESNAGTGDVGNIIASARQIERMRNSGLLHPNEAQRMAHTLAGRMLWGDHD